MKAKNRNKSSDAGVALILTLCFLVLLTVVIIGFASSISLDSRASSSHLESMRARVLAHNAVAVVSATLQRETGDRPIDTTNAAYIARNWISEPGAIVGTDPTSTDKTKLKRIVPLSSGSPSANMIAGTGIPGTLMPPNLNIEFFVDQSGGTTIPHLLSEQTGLDGQTVTMPVRWVYQRKDGTLDLGADGLPTEVPVLTNKTNPIVGRYAYWTDDESTKVNYNLAWGHDARNTNPAGHPTKVDLLALDGFNTTLAFNVHNFITTDNYTTVKRFFNSPLDVRQLSDTSTRAALNANKFNLTHYNADPDTTYYGRSRMMLTTQLNNAAVRDAAGNILKDSNNKPITRPFLDIVKNPSFSSAYIDPGITGTTSIAGNIDAAKLNTVVSSLVNDYLKRSDWPMVDGTGHTIQEKYYTTYTGAARDQRLAQLALNIIDYVRSAESKRSVVQPIRAKWLSGIFTPDFINSSIQGTDDTFKGLVRAPYITEMGMWVSDTPEPAGGVNAGRYHFYLLNEIHLPENYGLGTLDLMNTDGNKWTLYQAELPRTTTVTVAGVTTTVQMYYTVAGGGITGNEFTVTNPKVASSPMYVWEARNETAAQVASPTSATKMKAGDYRVLVAEGYRLKSKTDTTASTASLRTAITVIGGPRIDVAPLATPLTYKLDATSNADNPLLVSSYESTDPRVNAVTKDWGIQNTAGTFGFRNSAYSKALTNAPLTVTPPQDLDKSGKVSDASLRMPEPFGSTNNPNGRVRTPGELGLIHTGVEGSNTAPAPGTPFRSLHLQPSSQPTTVVPDWAFMDLFCVPADIPLQANAIFAPRSSSAGGRVNLNSQPNPFDLQRTSPLAAVFFNARKSSLDSTTFSLSDAKIIAQNIYNRKLATKGKEYPAATGTVPKVFESPGEVVEIAGVADGGEESEETVRDVANLLTARGNVYTVYSVGQALKQTPQGALVVTAEYREQTMLERYLVSKGTTTSDDDEVRFRTGFSRKLTP